MRIYSPSFFAAVDSEVPVSCLDLPDDLEPLDYPLPQVNLDGMRSGNYLAQDVLDPKLLMKDSPSFIRSIPESIETEENAFLPVTKSLSCHINNADSCTKKTSRRIPYRKTKRYSHAEAGQEEGTYQTPEKIQQLQRNRIAAAKCRRKRKDWVEDLECEARKGAQHHTELQKLVLQLQGECQALREHGATLVKRIMLVNLTCRMT